MSITATIQVSFGADSEAEGHLSAEIDSRADGLNGGKTSFAPGETAYFLVYTSDNVSYDPPIPSAGSIISASAGSVEKTEDITFSDSDTASLPVPATAITNVNWMGRSLGNLTLTDPMTVRASAKGVAVCKVTYTTTPNAHGLVSPATLNGLVDFSILVFIRGHLDS